MLQAQPVLANGSGLLSAYQAHLQGRNIAEAEHESQERLLRRVSYCAFSDIQRLCSQQENHAAGKFLHRRSRCAMLHVHVHALALSDEKGCNCGTYIRNSCRSW